MPSTCWRGPSRQPVRRHRFSDEGLATGRAEAADAGLTNAEFLARDVATLDVTEAYDVITAFDAIHDQAHPAGCWTTSAGRCARAAPS
jgi:hypothetical protein